MAGVKPVPIQMDSAMQDQFAHFQEFLNDIKLPPTVDRRERPRDGSQYDITIASLCEFDQILSIFIEGSRSSPESLVFCTSASWLSRQPSSRSSGLYCLYVHQGITVEKGGQSFVDKFIPPRKVTYFINHMVSAISEARLAEGGEVSKWDLDTPSCSSIQLNQRVNNALLTTTMCAAAGQRYPATLGFWVTKEENNNKHQEDLAVEYEDIIAVRLQPGTTDPDRIRAKVEEFLQSSAMQHYDKVVVKPFGPPWNSWKAGKSVSYHSKDEVKCIVRSTTDLLAVAEEGTGVVLQAFIRSLEPLAAAGLGRHALHTARKQWSFRVRAIVSRVARLKKAKMTQVLNGDDDV